MKTKKVNVQNPQGLTTEEEFTLALTMLSRCIITIKCGCDYNSIDKDYLRVLCKEFLEL